MLLLVLLPGFQKGRDIKASKGQGAALAKKGQFASYTEKLEKLRDFTTFSVSGLIKRNERGAIVNDQMN
jgi:hypothetical protein